MHELSTADDDTIESIVANTKNWLQKAVIGLGLCPFANAAYISDRIRYRVTLETTPSGLLDELADELELLDRSEPAQVETTLLIHPRVLSDFLDYNDFLGDADDALDALQLAGKIQIASFHPHYQFADAEPDAIENYTNRSPYPMLHLLREDSVTRAIEEFPDVESVPNKNIATLRALGHAGWGRLWSNAPTSDTK